MNRSRKLSEAGFLALCVLPAFLLYVILYIGPTLSTFWISLFEYSGVGGDMKFVGLDNFLYMAQDANLLKSFGNNLILMIFVPIPTLALALASAAALSRKDLRERNFYRTVFFFPSILSFVVVAIVWYFIFAPTSGLLNSGLNALGLGDLALPWLGDERTALGAVVAVLIWQAFGYYMVMYIAGIDSIPRELYEAAEVDGATESQQFFQMTVPMLWPIIRVTLVFMIGGTITISFIVASVLTNGGPNFATETALNQMYRQGTRNANYGYAMAIAVVVFVFSMALSLLSNRLTAQEEKAA